ncbi:MULTISPECIES: Gfo/Idh/MocA family protein [unclassified Plantactinospora]|uniref:Gfo/Idh/MocA family protein n=1 Tax=unclassified Plantactinospora TaxID=2631981 RepID=UPI000D1731CF|nr:MULTISPECIES: Gfo/Idh/MocA family oxidoreductase [unclassified Plantactinospora]AVT30428.1 oxidoreductase [Plantactinospora sp. BC1]AVT36926.1 oxidoreductase [Plantactinospora sp. BB1]
MLTFGLFGTGHWAAEVHAAALAGHPRARLAGVWGRDPAKAEALADRYGVPAYADADALIEDVQAVSVALPPDVQADLAVRAATAGRHLLLDKPLALSLPDADRVVAAAAQSGVASVVFFTNRFQPAISTFLASAAATGGWQSARGVHYASIFQPGNPYGGSAWRRTEGALWDVGPHALSLVLPVLGEVTEVAAMSGPRNSVHLTLAHGESATSTLSLALDAPPASTTVEFAFYGDDGIAVLPERDSTPVDALRLAIEQLCTEVDSGTRDQQCDVRFGRDVVSVLAAAQTAREQRRTVTLPS